jgi:hypothetical protein
LAANVMAIPPDIVEFRAVGRAARTYRPAGFAEVAAVIACAWRAGGKATVRSG